MINLCHYLQSNDTSFSNLNCWQATSVLVPYVCHKKLPQIRWLKITEMYSPKVWRPEVWNPSVSRSVFPLEALESNPSSPLPAFGAASFLCGYITTISASVFRWLSLLCVCIFSFGVCVFLICVFLIGTLIIAFRAHPNNPRDLILRSLM